MEKTAITSKDLCTGNRPEKQEAVITAKDLCIGYRSGKQEKRVHEHLSFRLFPGELTCLLGANGTGKSTLLPTLAEHCPLRANRYPPIRRRNVRAPSASC